MINYRYANSDDSYDIAYVLAYSNKETYTELMPDDFLNNRILNIDKSSLKRRKELEDGQKYILACDGNKIIGVSHVKSSDNILYKDYAYLQQLYLLKDYHGYGIGKELFRLAILDAINDGYNKMYLECAVGNNTLNFYKHYNCLVHDTVNLKFGNIIVNADILTYDNLSDTLNILEKNTIKKI